MTAMNLRGVVKAGLVAGLVLNVIDFLSNTFVVGNGMQAELSTVNPSLWIAMTDPANIIIFIAIDFALGLLVVWLYAALRPRFGPGPATAMRAGAFTWAVATLMWTFFLLMGLSSAGNFVLSGAISLGNFLVSALAGGRLYTEHT